MKTKLFAAALAAVTFGAIAQTASAQEFRGDWRRSAAEITVRQDGRTMSFDRGDRMFYRLMDRPFNFVPGLSYAYTDRCNRFGCQVIVYSQRAHRVVSSQFAPRVFNRNDRRDGDRRYNDRRFDERDGRNNDDRRYDNDRNGNDDGLYGAPR